VIVLQDVGVCALQYARLRPCKSLRRREARGVLAEFAATPAGFDADHLYVRIPQKRVKQSNRVRTAADAGIQMGWQSLLLSQNLLACLAPDHRLKVTHHGGIRMGAEHRTE